MDAVPFRSRCVAIPPSLVGAGPAIGYHDRNITSAGPQTVNVMTGPKPIPAERWNRIETLFEQALELPQGQQEAFLRDRCGEDETLYKEVRSLLAATSEASSQLGAVVEEAALNVVEPGHHPKGQRVGPYRLGMELGQGGMGAVFLAHRADDEFKQRVAIKFIGGVLSKKAIERFKLERQALADLSHPNIAHLIDGGTTADGQPYLAMEYVAGQSLLEYCDSQRLDIKGRVELFAQVCDAVHEAHSHYILHRDLKPSNILVNDKGVPKLLDFGIAKLLERGDNPTLTVTGMRLLTPAYASPEQIQGHELSPASDIYSLGVLLHELCTGCKPYLTDDETLSSLERVICYQDPTRPSDAIAEETDGLMVAAQRGTEMSTLRQALAGELDNIVLKALRKEPERRYTTAKEYADDLRRFLLGERVRAEAPGWGYRLRRLWHRNRLNGWRYAAALGLASLLVLITYLSTSDPESASRGDLSIAVLPLLNLDGSSSGMRFADGLSDELQKRLSDIEGLSVAARTSAASFKDRPTDVRTIAEQLRVRYLLEGSVRHVGTTLRVAAQLIDTDSGFQVWGRTYEQEGDQVLTAQEEIATQIVDGLRVYLLPADAGSLAVGDRDGLGDWSRRFPVAVLIGALGLIALLAVAWMRSRRSALAGVGGGVAAPTTSASAPTPSVVGEDSKQLGVHARRLPLPRTPFLGREEELARIAHDLGESQSRLISLVGPGGIGKTRLAVQAALEQSEYFRDGVFFVPLAAVGSPERVVSAIADVLELRFAGAESGATQVINFLHDKQVLLVLDNFESLLEATDLVVELLGHLPELRFIVTSRERLSIRGEVVHWVRGLPYPERDDITDLKSFAAICLFEERAAAADAGFQLVAADEPHVVKICRLLDGLPLGVELAAAWIRVLPCQEIAEEIENSLDFLSDGLRDLPERQRTLRAVFENSCRHIDAEDQKAFTRLCVFRGGFDRVAARQVAGASLQQMTVLLDKSLVQRNPGYGFTIQELLRQFGEEKLAQDTDDYRAVRDLHSDYFASFLAQRLGTLRGKELKTTANEIQSHIDNIRFAWTWSIREQNLQVLEACIEPLLIVFETQSRLRDGLSFFETAAIDLAKYDEDAQANSNRWKRLCGFVQAAHAAFQLYLADYQNALDTAQRAVGAVDSLPSGMEVGYGLYILAAAEQSLGLYDTAADHLERSIGVLDQINDRYRANHSRIALGQIEVWRGRTNEAKQLFGDAIRGCVAIGDMRAKHVTEMFLGEILLDEGEAEKASRLFKGALSILRDLNDRRWIVSCLQNLGRAAIAKGAHEEARRVLVEGLQVARDMGDKRRQSMCLQHLGEIARERGDLDAAMASLTESLTVFDGAYSAGDIHEILLQFVRTFLLADDIERAAELLGAVRGHLGSKMSTQKHVSLVHEQLESVLGKEGMEAKLKQGEDRDLEELVGELVAEHFARTKQL